MRYGRSGRQSAARTELVSDDEASPGVVQKRYRSGIVVDDVPSRFGLRHEMRRAEIPDILEKFPRHLVKVETCDKVRHDAALHQWAQGCLHRTENGVAFQRGELIDVFRE